MAHSSRGSVCRQPENDKLIIVKIISRAMFFMDYWINFYENKVQFF